jgi:hypothetical protein
MGDDELSGGVDVDVHPAARSGAIVMRARIWAMFGLPVFGIGWRGAWTGQPSRQWALLPRR